MVLIFGGVYQGKLDYAMERFEPADNDVYRCGEDNTGDPGGKKVVYELDKWILALVKAGADIEKAVRRFIADNKNAVVICNDVSCGVVPEDPVLRAWREAVGRALTMIARESDEVIRLFCGIPTLLMTSKL